MTDATVASKIMSTTGVDTVHLPRKLASLFQVNCLELC
jgi:hypothetical protein